MSDAQPQMRVVVDWTAHAEGHGDFMRRSGASMLCRGSTPDEAQFLRSGFAG